MTRLCFIDESQTKCIQYQDEISKLQTEIDEYKADLELKEKLVAESKHFGNFKTNVLY